MGVPRTIYARPSLSGEAWLRICMAVLGLIMAALVALGFFVTVRSVGCMIEGAGRADEFPQRYRLLDGCVRFDAARGWVAAIAKPAR